MNRKTFDYALEIVTCREKSLAKSVTLSNELGLRSIADDMWCWRLSETGWVAFAKHHSLDILTSVWIYGFSDEMLEQAIRLHLAMLDHAMRRGDAQ